MALHSLKRHKQLGVGVFGTTYLVEQDGKKYALKTQKILASQRKKNYRHPIWREMDLYQYVSKLKPSERKFFTQLHSYEIYSNCNHTQKSPFKIHPNGYLGKKLKSLVKSKWCLDILIDYHPGITLGKYLLTHSITPKQAYSFIFQIIHIMTILRKGGYSHNDLHLENVMINKTTDTHFTFRGRKIPLYGYQLVAIDYGEVLHKKFKMKNDLFRLFAKDQDEFLYREIRMTMFKIVTNFDRYINGCRKKKKQLPWEGKKDPFTNLINSIITKHHDFWVRESERLITDDGVGKLIQKVEKQISQKKLWEIIGKSKYRNEAWDVANDVTFMFQAHHPKLSAKYYGWCSSHKFNLKKDVYIALLEAGNLPKLLAVLYQQM